MTGNGIKEAEYSVENIPGLQDPICVTSHFCTMLVFYRMEKSQISSSMAKKISCFIERLRYKGILKHVNHL